MKENNRAGFMIITIPSGKTALLAKKNLPSPHRVGSYGISLKDLEDTGCRAIQKALDSARFIVVDEIGKMELFSKEFQRLIIEAMESPVKFLATIMERSNAFADWVKSRGDVQLIHLTRENSEQVFVKVQNWMVE
jgi:nucleoside-triphosphatase